MDDVFVEKKAGTGNITDKMTMDAGGDAHRRNQRLRPITRRKRK
jgi:hypothetical protein